MTSTDNNQKSDERLDPFTWSDCWPETHPPNEPLISDGDIQLTVTVEQDTLIRLVGVE